MLWDSLRPRLTILKSSLDLRRNQTILKLRNQAVQWQRVLMYKGILKTKAVLIEWTTEAIR